MEAPFTNGVGTGLELGEQYVQFAHLNSPQQREEDCEEFAENRGLDPNSEEGQAWIAGFKFGVEQTMA